MYVTHIGQWTYLFLLLQLCQECAHESIQDNRTQNEICIKIIGIRISQSIGVDGLVEIKHEGVSLGG
jgi:hypothetical protein